jgi:tetratricopeptide (TPR) repeat protein
MGKRKPKKRKLKKRPDQLVPAAKETNSEVIPSQPEIKNDRTITKTQKKRRFILLTIMGIFIVLLYWLIFNISTTTDNREMLQDLPHPPRADNMVGKEIKKLDESARELPLDGSEIGKLGGMYHANLFFKEAEACYKIARKIDPGNPRWPYFLASIYQKLGLYEDIEALLEQTIDLAPDYYPALLKLADIHFKLGKQKEAEAGYKKLVSLNVKNEGPYAYLGLGRISMAKNEWEAAQKYLENAIKMDRNFGVAYRLLANVHEHFGRTKKMKQCLAQVGKYRFAEASDPWVDSLVLLCFDDSELIRQIDIAFKTFKIGRASEITKRAVSLFPNNIELHLKVGLSLVQIFEFSKALIFLEKAIELDPDNLEALTNKGMCLVELKRLDEAEEYFQRVLRIDPSSALGLYNRGFIMFQKGKHEEAINLINESITRDPQRPDSHFSLGVIKKIMGKKEEAIAHFKNALSVQPKFPNAHSEIGFLLLQLGEKEEAIFHLNEELINNPDNASCHYILGNERASENNFPEAIEHYKEAIRINPGLIGAHVNLGVIYENQGKLDPAVELYQKLIKMKPDEARGYFGLGRVLLKKGKHKDAAIQLKKALYYSNKSRNSQLETEIKRILGHINNF